jgi:hypothetical protein
VGEQRAGRAISVRLLAALSFLLAVIAFGSIALLWAREAAEPSVSLIGSGDRLSVLVTAGPSRLLIATGDDAAAFANGLEKVRRPTNRRIDLLFVAGSGADLTVPAAAAADPNIRLQLAIAPFPRSAEQPSLQAIQVVSTPRRVTLSGGVSVTVESALLSGPSESPERWAWRAVIAHGQSRVIVLSAGDDADLFGPADSANALVVAGGKPLEAWREHPAQLLVFADAAIAPRDLRASVATDEDGPDWAVRVFPGEAVTLRFTTGGVVLDGPAERLTPGSKMATPAA